MRRSLKTLLPILLVFWANSSLLAQDESKYLLNPRVSFAVPHGIMNKALKRTFTGIYDINASFNVNPIGNFQLGLAYKHTLLTIPANKIAGLQETGMLLNNVGLRIGYDQYYSKNIFFSYGFTFGQSYTSFNAVPCIEPLEYNTSYNSIYFEPEVGLNFLIEEMFAIGIILSFNYAETPFVPSRICLENYATYLESDYKNPTGILNFGFGFYYGLVKK